MSRSTEAGLAPAAADHRVPRRADATDAADFYRSIVAGMRCAVLCVDRHGRLALVNDLAAQILELDPVPAPGMALDLALERHPRVAEILGSCFESQQLPNREELVLATRTGSRRTVGYTVSRIAPDGGAPAGLAMFFKDLTRIEQKAEQERLRDRLAALGQMAASLAHGIRNPLASIDVTCALLRRRLGGDAATRELVEKITAEVTRLNATVTSSLEFVRPISPSVVPTDLTPLLEEALDVAVSRAGKPGVALTRRIAAPLPQVPADRVLVRQVFENLLLNALEAVGERGTVSLRVWIEPPEAASPGRPSVPVVAVEIADDGPGIADAHRDEIFHPFFTTKEQGSGVGLAAAKKVVDCHHGSIEVASQPGAGATFTVRLPLASAPTED